MTRWTATKQGNLTRTALLTRRQWPRVASADRLRADRLRVITLDHVGADKSADVTDERALRLVAGATH